ncbi:MAG: hypothetical protein Q8Q09_23905 [Deltaproteobacteria bacterium]|nr:hypothetical protein [Deltaproteobacteria bacterium]
MLISTRALFPSITALLALAAGCANLNEGPATLQPDPQNPLGRVLTRPSLGEHTLTDRPENRASVVGQSVQVHRRQSPTSFSVLVDLSPDYTESLIVAYNAEGHMLARRLFEGPLRRDTWRLELRDQSQVVSHFGVTLYPRDVSLVPVVGRVVPTDRPEIAVGEPCDPTGVANLCVGASSCVSSRDARCVLLDPPTIESSEAWTQGGRLLARGTMRSAAPGMAIEWRMADQGTAVADWRTDGLRQYGDGNGGLRVTLELADAGTIPTRFQWRTIVRASDRGPTADVVSSTTESPIQRVSLGAVGSPCLQNSAIVCDPGLRCVADAVGTFACRAVPQRCSSQLTQFGELPVPSAGNSVSLAIRPVGSGIACVTSCGATGRGANVPTAWRFTAPSDGSYAFRWTPAAGSTLGQVALRHNCEAYQVDPQESCLPTTGPDAGLTRRMFRAGEEILVMPHQNAGAGTISVTAE